MLVGKITVGYGAFVMVMFVAIHALGEMVRVDRDLHHIQIMPIGIENE